MSARRKTVAELRASGSHHYPKEVLARREARELRPPAAVELEPPAYLPASLREKFCTLAPLLVDMGLLSALDGDGLARYLIAEQQYLRVTNRLTAAIHAGNTAEADRWSAMQDRFFRQCRVAAGDLGLTLSGRCRLSLPEPEARQVEGEEASLFGG